MSLQSTPKTVALRLVVLQNMKTLSSASVLSGSSIILSLWWLFGALFKPLMRMATETATTDYLFALTVLPIMSIPGVMGLYYGLRLLGSRDSRNIKGAVGSISIYGAIALSSGIEHLLPNRELNMLSLLAAALVAVPFYVALSKFIIAKECRAELSRSEFLGKGVIALLSWLIWLALNEVIEAYAPIKDGYTHVKEEPWGIIGFIGSIVLAVAFYKLSLNLLQKHTAEHEPPRDAVPAARPPRP